MSTFTKDRRMAHVDATSETLSLSAEFAISPNNLVSNFNGSLINGDTAVGRFNLNEDAEGQVNYTYNGTQASRAAAETVVFATLADIHSHYDTEQD